MVLLRLTEPRRCEATRSDRNEDTRPLHVSRQLLRHEPVDKGGEDHKRKTESHPLHSDCGHSYGQSIEGARVPDLDG